MPITKEFLYYQERDRSPVELEMASDSDTTYVDFPVRAHDVITNGDCYIYHYRHSVFIRLASHGLSPSHTSRNNLVKQTYSVLVHTPTRGRQKWHLSMWSASRASNFQAD